MEAVFLSNVVLLICAALVVAGTVSSLVAARFGAPILLMFLLIGMVAGEDGPGGIHFSDFWATYMVGSAALAVILFDGGLRMRAATMRGALAPALLLSTVGVVATAGLVALVAGPLLGLTVLQSLLVGAIVASTDAAAVLFLVRAQGLRLGRRVGAVIEVESATNDPAAVFLTVLLVELITSGTGDVGWTIVLGVFREMTVGALMGVGMGFLLAVFLNRIDLPGGLQPVMVVAVAVFTFALTALLQGSGFLAVYLAGLVLGNRPVRGIAGITSFHDTITWLCQIVMFTMLGLLVTPRGLMESLPAGLAVAGFLVLVARPAVVFTCLTWFGFSFREKAFVSWAGLRGAVSIFLATIPMLAQLPLAPLYFNIAFIVVLVSLVLHGATLATSARRLGVALSGPMREPRRFEIDLPGQSEHELVGYPVTAQTPTIAPGLLPTWTRPLLVVRAGHILGAEEAGAFLSGDYVYLLTPPQRVKQLDRVFMSEPLVWGDDAAFPFSGDVRIGDVADLYGLAVAEADRHVTLADAFADRADDRPMPGMRFALGAAFVEVRRVDSGRVTQVALRLGEASDAAPPGRLDRWKTRARRIVSGSGAQRG
ncbi:potassium/proton antiporter [Aquabacter spiritensis]|uniref:Potassium/proton antiporter (CPA1 family) n=1 Tax=Aquabacter spiritensis TaxID=933073 RepID=A0A4R3LQK9_9HYPH|nr:potassium/proton antiporter [Aquabacter spiritensis]TCT02670.1 potassium/proton antiporter (CPA1 family) [Aquabacter spiritensis]